MTERAKFCYCYTCEKHFHRLGIASHRASHRNRMEDCRILLSDGSIRTYHFSRRKERK